MPAGVSWPQYLKFLTASLLSMFIGAQVVHVYYRPLDDMNKYIEDEILKSKLEEKQNKQI